MSYLNTTRSSVPPFRAQTQAPRGAVIHGKDMGVVYQERKKRKFFRKLRIAQLNWAEHCTSSSSLGRLTPQSWWASELLLLRIFWWSTNSVGKANANSLVPQNGCHQHHEQIFIRCMCWAMLHSGYGCAFLLFRKTWAPVLTPTIYWSWASYPTFWASVFSSTRAGIKAYLPEL